MKDNEKKVNEELENSQSQSDSSQEDSQKSGAEIEQALADASDPKKSMSYAEENLQKTLRKQKLMKFFGSKSFKVTASIILALIAFAVTIAIAGFSVAGVVMLALTIVGGAVGLTILGVMKNKELRVPQLDKKLDKVKQEMDLNKALEENVDLTKKRDLVLAKHGLNKDQYKNKVSFTDLEKVLFSDKDVKSLVDQNILPNKKLYPYLKSYIKAKQITLFPSQINKGLMESVATKTGDIVKGTGAVIFNAASNVGAAATIQSTFELASVATDLVSYETTALPLDYIRRIDAKLDSVNKSVFDYEKLKELYFSEEKRHNMLMPKDIFKADLKERAKSLDVVYFQASLNKRMMKYLKEYLDKHPGKTAADFSQPEVLAKYKKKAIREYKMNQMLIGARRIKNIFKNDLFIDPKVIEAYEYERKKIREEASSKRAQLLNSRNAQSTQGQHFRTS